MKALVLGGTKRLFFYVEHILNRQAINVDNCDARLTFINSGESGCFLAWCAEKSIWGYVNACSNGSISLSEIINYVENRTGIKALIREDGEPAPLNGVPSFSLDTAKAQDAGFKFLSVSEWVYPLIDYWIDGLT